MPGEEVTLEGMSKMQISMSAKPQPHGPRWMARSKYRTPKKSIGGLSPSSIL